jgi:hypothetical protein
LHRLHLARGSCVVVTDTQAQAGLCVCVI